MVEEVGADVSQRVVWVEGDLATWTAQPGHVDLVVCLYVHRAGSVQEMVRRIATDTDVLIVHGPVFAAPRDYSD
jgi:hypothetical protein